MTLRFRFDPDKAVEVILYIAEKCPDKYHLLKSLYFADLDHLEKYGRFICGDTYKAMKYGPVPSGTYQLLDQSDMETYLGLPTEDRLPFEIVDNEVKPYRKADRRWLSKSDIECLDIAVDDCKSKPFNTVKNKSHDTVYNATPLNEFMPLEAIALSLPSSEALLEYLLDC